MKIDDSNGRYSTIIAWILLGIVIIFIAFTLGVMGARIFSDNDVHPREGGVSETSGKSNSENLLNISQGNEDLVPGSKRDYCNIPTIETKPGKIEIYEVSLDPNYEMPLCFTDADLDELNAALTYKLLVCGGYTPVCWTSYADVLQENIWTDTVRTDKGDLKIQWTNIGKPDDGCCCCSIWKAEFIDVIPDKICLVSSQGPSILPPCTTMYDDEWCNDKEVKLEVVTYWKGCWFWTISASDFHFPESPAPNEF